MNILRYVVHTTDLNPSLYMNDLKAECVPVLDARSAVYVATGIAAQNNNPVLVLLNSSNASRSAFSGMTEAFYRNLPVVLVTVGTELNYSRELNDTVYGHFVVSSPKEIYKLAEGKLPIHIELSTDVVEYEPLINPLLNVLKTVLTEQDYLYSSQNIKYDYTGFDCKTVDGGTPNCMEGALANVLGASLANKRRRYVGVVTEDEFFHDMNSLGNININDSLVFIVLCNKTNKIIMDYSNSLGFSISVFNMTTISSDALGTIMNNCKKSIVIVEGIK